MHVARDERQTTAMSMRLEAFWKEAAAAAELAFADRRVSLDVNDHSSGPDYLAHELALQAVDLLQDVPIARTRLERRAASLV
jgi:hypothetical protein